jgi:hypothetical protein
MISDILWGIAMAFCVALVPNLIYSLTDITTTLSQKISFIAALAAGAAFTAPLFLKNKNIKNTLSSKYLPWYLGFSGIIASTYFLAVVGLQKGPGLGPGIAETLDSSLAPCFYLLIYFLTTWKEEQSRPKVPPKVLGGTFLIFFGLLFMGFRIVEHKTSSNFSELTYQDIILVIFGIIGAVGTTFSLWCLRRLVRVYKTPLGKAISYRYGGVAILYIIIAIITSIYDHNSPKLIPLLQSFIGGTILINGALYASVKINSENATAASVGLIPVLALTIEYLLHKTHWISSTTPFSDFGLVIGFISTTIGIFLIQLDPSTSKLWPEKNQSNIK